MGSGSVIILYSIVAPLTFQGQQLAVLLLLLLLFPRNEFVWYLAMKGSLTHYKMHHHHLVIQQQSSWPDFRQSHFSQWASGDAFNSWYAKPINPPSECKWPFLLNALNIELTLDSTITFPFVWIKLLPTSKQMLAHYIQKPCHRLLCNIS